jgi:hypothetical protein
MNRRHSKSRSASGPSLRDPWTEHPTLVKLEAGREIARLRARNEELVEALGECADELEMLIEHQYGNTQDAYPSQLRRYERDIAPVRKARAAIAKTKGEKK